MHRFAQVLVATVAMTVPMIAIAGAASADPLESLRVVHVFVTGDGDVCITYNDLSTVCTNV